MLGRTWRLASAGLLLLLFGVILGMTRCGKKEQVAGASPQPAPAAPTAAPPAAAAPAASAPSSDLGSPTSTASLPAGLGVQEQDAGGVDVALLEVKRTSGDTLTLKWQYRNKTRENKELAPNNISGYGLSSGAYLIDSVNKKKYLGVTDARGYALAAEHNSTSLGAGQTLTTWAKFPAPPPDVRTISVFIPHVPPFEDVPIGQ